MVSMEFTDLAPATPLIQAGKLKLIALLGATARSGHAERADRRRNRARLRGAVLAGPVRARRHAEDRSSTTSPRYLAADLKRPETVARFKAIGIVAQSDTPERIPRLHRLRERQMGQGDPTGEDRAAVTPSPRPAYEEVDVEGCSRGHHKEAALESISNSKLDAS